MTAGVTARQFNPAESSSGAPSWRIERGFIDARGESQTTSSTTIAAIARALDNGKQEPARYLTVLRQDEPYTVEMDHPVGRWRLLLAELMIAGGETSEAFVDLPSALPIGSYRLVTEGASISERLIIVAPREAHQPPYFRDGGRAWLLAVQLYSVQSSHNWGHGDFTDLAKLLRIAAQAGAAGVGVNPLHALAPGQASPYSPSSRVFLNPLYIDVDAIPEFGSTGSGELAANIAKLRDAELVDHSAIHELKQKALRIAYAAFNSATRAERRKSFDAFCESGSVSLQAFCAFEHLRERFGGGWQRWPAEWRDSRAAVEKLGSDKLEFYAFVQWIAHEQLMACSNLARSLGLPIGLYLDIAVGVDAGGADAWANPDTISYLLSIGAPPDVYNPAGQNWGLAAPHPQALIDTDFAIYRQALGSAMRYAGAIRIDHALGLNRLFLVPAGSDAAGGGYVSFPFNGMLAIIAQESVAHRCLVIGEDLGTIPDGVCEKLNQWGIWSYRVALFERENNGERFRPPEHFPERAIITLNTHDLPTFEGWNLAHDLQTKRSLALDPGETDDERKQALDAMRNTLAHHGLPQQLSLSSILHYLARTRCQLLSVSIEDIAGVKEQPNIPGTIDEHPNWRRKLPLSLEDFAAAAGLHRVATALREEGRGFESKQ